ncbi:MAG: H4MPT-linked C1 transfer pathway protein [Methanoregula sp.]|nr:H4MPT-linked C1 transfer pathway protein [Methanoregula sp.]
MIGIDVGGANLKVVDDAGVHIHYCPLWEGAPLPSLLREYKKSGQDSAAVVMSGELADCFLDKMQGIAFIVKSVCGVFPDARFYGTDAAFHRDPVPQLAAANWLASADFLRERYMDAVLLDVGSTTADIIPLSRFSDLCGLSDLGRLRKGYLIYTGMLRTNIVTLLSAVNLDGVNTPVSSEYFADLEEIGERGAVQIANQFWDRQRRLIWDQVCRVVAETNASDVIVAGTGASIFVRQCGGFELSEELGPAADALPAYAVREVARRSGCFASPPVIR